MEIEKKYLISYMPDIIKSADLKIIEQAYLSINPVVRIRRSNDKYLLTYKSHDGVDMCDDVCVSNEVELPLTKDSYEHLKTKADGMIISKKRYVLPLKLVSSDYDDLKAEIDVFSGELEGLVFTEVEFDSIDQAKAFSPPEWFGEDVSEDVRYRNSYLSGLKDRDEFLKVFS